MAHLTLKDKILVLAKKIKFWSWHRGINFSVLAWKDKDFGLGKKDKILVLAKKISVLVLAKKIKILVLAKKISVLVLAKKISVLVLTESVCAKTENVTYRIRTYYGKMVLTGLAESWRADLTRKR